MGRLPDNYIGPKQRITMLKKAYPNEHSAIKTSAQLTVMDSETLCVLIKATIEICGQVVAEGHAFTAEPNEDKAVEKAETIAIGRALVNAGYPETDEEGDGDAPVKKEKARGGLGSKVAKKPEPEETDEADDEEEVEEKPAKKVGGLGSRLGGGTSKPAVSSKANKGAVVEETDEADDEESEEESPKVEEKPASTGKMTREELLAKYKKKSN